MAAEVWINSAWSGLPDGTEVEPGLIIGSNAFAEIQRGVNAVDSFGTVRAAAGEYEEAVTMSGPGKTGVSLIGDPGAVIDGSSFGSGEYGLSIAAAEVTVTGFTVRNFSVSYAIVIVDAADVTLSQNSVEQNGLGSTGFRGGIYARDAAGLRILDNNIVNNHSEGLILDSGVHDAVVAGNRIEGSGGVGLFIGGTAGTSAPTATARVENNVISNNGQGIPTPLDPVDQFSIPGHGGIVIWDAGASLKGNTIEGNNPDGIIWLHFEPEKWDAGGGPPPAAFNIVENNSISSQPRAGMVLFNLVTTFLPPVGPVSPPPTPAINDNAIENNGLFGIVAVGGSNPTAAGNSITGNGAGLVNTWEGITIGGTFFPPVDIEAGNNWWGSPTGPFNPDKNPEGTGDSVSDFVIFTPWLGEPADGEADVQAHIELAVIFQAAADVNMIMPVGCPSGAIKETAALAVTRIFDSCKKTVQRNIRGRALFPGIDLSKPFDMTCHVEGLTCRPLKGTSPGEMGAGAAAAIVNYEVVFVIEQNGVRATAPLEDGFAVTVSLNAPPGAYLRCAGFWKSRCRSTVITTAAVP